MATAILNMLEACQECMLRDADDFANRELSLPTLVPYTHRSFKFNQKRYRAFVADLRKREMLRFSTFVHERVGVFFVWKSRRVLADDP